MNEMKVARKLGWFSIGLGLAEVAAGRTLGRLLGVEDRDWLIRLFGLREIGAGVGILMSEDPAPWVWARVGGDVLDLAAIGSAYSDDNPEKANVAAAFVAVAGITALDYWCVRRLHSGRPHGSLAAHRRLVAEAGDPSEIIYTPER